MRFAGYQQEGRFEHGGFAVGVLRSGKHLLWSCDHLHDTRRAAVECAYHQEGIAIAAGLLPEPPQVKWDDPATWPPGLAADVARRKHAPRGEELDPT